MIVDPVDEGDVGSLSHEVASGIGGIILLKATPCASPAALRQRPVRGWSALPPPASAYTADDGTDDDACDPCRK